MITFRAWFMIAGVALLLSQGLFAKSAFPSLDGTDEVFTGYPSADEREDLEDTTAEDLQQHSRGQDDRSDWPAPVHDDQRFSFLRAEQLEVRSRSRAPDLFVLEAQGWYGGDYRKLWVKADGEQTLEGDSEGEFELQVLYGHLVAPFWDFQVGLRYDTQWSPGPNDDRWLAVIGFQGLSPYEFELDSALFLSEDGDVSFRLTASTDFLFTQRLILQPRFETEFAFQDVPKLQVGQGFNYVDLGLRLRYEIRREFAPYLGINWIRSLGETKDIARRLGGDTDDFTVVFGVATWH